ncbi:MAG: ABC transporter permease [Acidimicrobiales bacterium]
MQVVDPSGPEVLTTRTRVRRALPRAVACAFAGVALIFLTLDPFGALAMTLKGPLVLFGLLLIGRAVGIAGVAWRGPTFDTGLVLSIGWIVALGLAATFAGLLPLSEHVDTVATLNEPGKAHPDLLSAHPFGTNNFGLDILARSIYGARVSLLTAVVGVVGSLLIGGTVGLIAGYRRGRIDAAVGIVTDSFLAFPALVMLIALATVLGPPATASSAILKTGVSLAITSMPVMARLVRANTMSVAQREFVQASWVIGARQRRILFREILPSVAVPVVAYAFVMAAVLIVAEGSLAYLGLGLQPPEPTWGNMIAEADFTTLREHPHIALVPGVFLFLSVYSMSRIGDRLGLSHRDESLL